MRPDVSVVIPTRDAGERLDAVLSGVRAQATQRRVEIVAIDSGSRDGTRGILQAHGARLQQVAPESFDHGLTRNQALAAAQAPLVVLLTQDAEPADANWLEALLAPLADPAVAGSYSRQEPRREADVLTQRHVRGSLTGSPLPRVQQRATAPDFARLTPLERLRLCCFDHVSAAVRRSVWERIPYGPAYFAEDLEWGKRVVEAGFTLVYAPGSVVIHSHDRSLRYEYLRAYACHRRLYRLFGLRSVPRLRHALRNTAVASVGDALYVWRQEKHWRARLALLARAPARALASNLGQWRGAADEHGQRPLPALKGL